MPTLSVWTSVGSWIGCGDAGIEVGVGLPDVVSVIVVVVCVFLGRRRADICTKLTHPRDFLV